MAKRSGEALPAGSPNAYFLFVVSLLFVSVLLLFRRVRSCVAGALILSHSVFPVSLRNITAPAAVKKLGPCRVIDVAAPLVSEVHVQARHADFLARRRM